MSEPTAAIRRPAASEIEAGNRAEATALLIRAGYRVYRPEADCEGEDLVVRTPAGELIPVQLKSRPTVHQQKYGSGKLWMLFPDPGTQTAAGRDWFLVPHQQLFDWFSARHAHAPKWNDTWHTPVISRELRAFLEPFSHLRWAGGSEPTQSAVA